MNVYLVTNGDYDDYRVEFIFAARRDAEATAEGLGDGREVEARKVYSPGERPAIVTTWRARQAVIDAPATETVGAIGELIVSSETEADIGPPAFPRTFYATSWNSLGERVFSARGPDREQVEKSVRDRAEKYARKVGAGRPSGIELRPQF